MLQSNFKTKLNSVKHRERIRKWCYWKDLCKAEPEQYKIIIEGDATKVVLALFEKVVSNLPEKVGPAWALKDSLEWSLE